MSDQFYRQQAARRNRWLLFAGAALAALACGIASLVGVFRDDCTEGFDRTPRSVVLAYLEAVSAGKRGVVRRCWVPEAYFDLESGCSEICLSRAQGTDFQVVALELDPLTDAPAGRARLTARIRVSCTDGHEHSGDLVLDSLARNLPWRHWKIASSTVGGSYARPWCTE